MEHFRHRTSDEAPGEATHSQENEGKSCAVDGGAHAQEMRRLQETHRTKTAEHTTTEHSETTSNCLSVGSLTADAADNDRSLKCTASFPTFNASATIARLCSTPKCAGRQHTLSPASETNLRSRVGPQGRMPVSSLLEEDVVDILLAASPVAASTTPVPSPHSARGQSK